MSDPQCRMNIGPSAWDDPTISGLTIPTVFVIENEPSLRETLETLFRGQQIRAEFFSTVTDFLRDFDVDRHGCLLLDLHLADASNCDIQEHLVSRGCTLPVIAVVACGDMPMAVRAMKAGALDVIQAPFDSNALLREIRRALARDEELRRQRLERVRVESLLSQLTQREREVMDRLVAGATTKQIALSFRVSTQAIDAHRERILRKMQVSNVVELVKLLLGPGGNLPV